MNKDFRVLNNLKYRGADAKNKQYITTFINSGDIYKLENELVSIQNTPVKLSLTSFFLFSRVIFWLFNTFSNFDPNKSSLIKSLKMTISSISKIITILLRLSTSFTCTNDVGSYCYCDDEDSNISEDEREFLKKTDPKKISSIIDNLSKLYAKLTLMFIKEFYLKQDEINPIQEDLFSESNSNNNTGIHSLLSFLDPEENKDKDLFKEISMEAHENLVLVIYLLHINRFRFLFVFFYFFLSFFNYSEKLIQKIFSKTF
jgi:hypothetical protein